MPLNFGKKIIQPIKQNLNLPSLKSKIDFTQNVLPPEFHGVKTFQHDVILTSAEAKTIQRHLHGLYRDYPTVFDDQLKELHFFGRLNKPTRSDVSETTATIMREAMREDRDAYAVTLGHFSDLAGNISFDMDQIRAAAGKMQSSTGGKFTYIAASGRRSRNFLGPILEHEFGHAVQNTLMQPYDIEKMKHADVMAAGNMSEGARKIYQEMSVDPKYENLDEIGYHLAQRTAYNKHALPHYLNQSFNTQERTKIASIIGSDYARQDYSELFAEAFARGRLRIGPGRTEAGNFEAQIRSAVNRTARAGWNAESRRNDINPAAELGKMLRATKNATSQILDMRR